MRFPRADECENCFLVRYGVVQFQYISCNVSEEVSAAISG
jgi:hypothetical protein